jgi:hypothetical protein
MGQYALIDSGNLADEQRYSWVESVCGDRRTMATFVLATDAIQMHAYYQARETAECLDGIARRLVRENLDAEKRLQVAQWTLSDDEEATEARVGVDP